MFRPCSSPPPPLLHFVFFLIVFGELILVDRGFQRSVWIFETSDFCGWNELFRSRNGDIGDHWIRSARCLRNILEVPRVPDREDERVRNFGQRCLELENQVRYLQEKIARGGRDSYARGAQGQASIPSVQNAVEKLRKKTRRLESENGDVGDPKLRYGGEGYPELKMRRLLHW